MQSVAIITAFVSLICCLIGHKYQLTTLAVAKLYTKGSRDRIELSRLQIAMNPLWLGFLTIAEWVFAAVGVVLLYLEFSWWGPAVFVFLSYVGVGMAAPTLPLMPYTWNLMQIESFLRRCQLAVAMGEPIPEGAWIDAQESWRLQYLADRLKHDCSLGLANIPRISFGHFTHYSAYA